ncbi:Pentatricopeptide repeat-containing protein At3g53700, chloroplastic [Linum grandiflorum]
MALLCLHSQWFRRACLVDCTVSLFSDSSFRYRLLPSYMHHCWRMHIKCSMFFPLVEFTADVEEKSAVTSKKFSDQETGKLFPFVTKVPKNLNWRLAWEADFFQALRCQGSPHSAGWKNNIHTLLSKVVSSYQEADLDVLELSRCLLDSLELVEVLPSVFSEFIKVLAEKKMLENAVGVFVQARENKVEPHIPSCNFLLKCLMEGKKAEAFMDVFEQLRNFGPCPNVHTYTIVLNFYRSCDFIQKVDVVREMFEVLHEMISFGLTPSEVTYGTFVHGLCEAGCVELALGYVRDSRNTVCYFNSYCYNAIIHGFCDKGKVDEALNLLEEMRRCSVSPDVYSYSILIHGFCQKGDIKKGCSLWKEMRDRNIRPNIVTFTSLFSSLCKNGWVNYSLVKSHLIGDHEFEYDMTCYNILIEAWLMSG